MHWATPLVDFSERVVIEMAFDQEHLGSATGIEMSYFEVTES